jgi:alcohol dehydrogenase
MPASLSECGVTEDRIADLAEEASRQWTAGFNPRPMDVKDFETLYRQALEPAAV